MVYYPFISREQEKEEGIAMYFTGLPRNYVDQSPK